MRLTEQNYFTQDASRQYMSASQLKQFLDCPARTVAELAGEYTREETDALLVGGFVDAYFSGTLDEFAAAHPQIYTNKGEMRAQYKDAMLYIAVLTQDDLLRRMLSGSVQKIATGEIAGVPFKGKIDSLLIGAQCRSIAEDYPEMAEDLMMADGAIVDLKVVKDLNPIWVNGRGKLSVSEAWRWELQLGIYQKLIGKKLPCFIVAVTKQKQPNKMLIRMPNYLMEAALESVSELIPKFNDMKLHPDTAPRCECCDYCFSSKVITSAIDADELDGATL